GERGLGRGVVGLALLAEDPGGRADQDEVARALALDLPQERPRHEERPREVRVDDPAEALGVDVDSRRGRRVDRGVADADVDRAVAVDRRREERVDVALLRDVGLDGDGVGKLGDQLLGLLAACLVVDDDLRTLAGESPRSCRAYPTRRTRDNHNAAGQVGIHGAAWYRCGRWRTPLSA